MDTPEASGLMTSLRKIGFEQESVGVNGIRLKHKGTFNGTQENLEALRRAVKSHRKKT